MVLPYIQGGSVESAMKYAYPKARLLLHCKLFLAFEKNHGDDIS